MTAEAVRVVNVVDRSSLPKKDVDPPAEQELRIGHRLELEVGSHCDELIIEPGIVKQLAHLDTCSRK